MSIKILDVSKHQPNINYKEISKAIDGVILRCGLTYWGRQNMGIDSYFEKHYAGFKAVGCPVGAYYYSCADSIQMAKKEAELCLSILQDKQFELPIYYDVENNERQGNLSKQMLTDIVDTFCTTIEKQGYFVGYYSSTDWLQRKLDTNYLSKKYTLWKADYRSNYDKKINCDMHQYTSNGNIIGINGRVDLSNCYVDFPTIIKKNGLNGFCEKSHLQNFSVNASKGDIGKFENLAKKLEIYEYVIK